ncbi:hypothetical protein T12_5249 [Trichinella patagoniensis]|uniref:Uncharacterized protein n=1 Tax=Trichinella patagoniensis TaxID=990121 RepID=A0A0V1A9F0_9BILA|nr:hypothetical protein T12_5249 [Trichinella patagoniensis]
MILMLRPMLPTVFGGNLNKGPAEKEKIEIFYAHDDENQLISSYKHNICDTIDGDKADISMSVFGLNSYPGNSTSGDSIVVLSVSESAANGGGLARMVRLRCTRRPTIYGLANVQGHQCQLDA